jgi:hypothetical protein
MRPLAFLLLLLASCGVLRAQVQERKLVDRLLQPDMSLGNPMQSMAYNGATTGGIEPAKDANVKDFSFIQKFSAKGYDTKDYAAKDYWQGEFQFSTKAAEVKADDAGQKVFATKTVAVKDARESAKGYAAAGQNFATREAAERGKTSQQHLDDIYKNRPVMSIDEIRDLLNKPKL